VDLVVDFDQVVLEVLVEAFLGILAFLVGPEVVVVVD